jgi:hypothetical protein
MIPWQSSKPLLEMETAGRCRRQIIRINLMRSLVVVVEGIELSFKDLEQQ